MSKPPVILTDGNAFAIMGVCNAAAKKAGWSKNQIDKVMAEMKSGDYAHLLQTEMKYFNCDVEPDDSEICDDCGSFLGECVCSEDEDE